MVVVVVDPPTLLNMAATRADPPAAVVVAGAVLPAPLAPVPPAQQRWGLPRKARPEAVEEEAVVAELGLQPQQAPLLLAHRAALAAEAALAMPAGKPVLHRQQADKTAAHQTVEMLPRATPLLQAVRQAEVAQVETVRGRAAMQAAQTAAVVVAEAQALAAREQRPEVQPELE